MKKRAKPKPKRRTRKTIPSPAIVRPLPAAQAARGVATPMAVALNSGRPAPAQAFLHVQAIARSIPTNDRSVFALLLMPFMIVAISLTMAQSRRDSLLALPAPATSHIERVAVAPVPPIAQPLPKLERAPAPQPVPADIIAEPARPAAPPQPTVAMPVPPLAFPPPAPVLEQEPAPPVAVVASLDRQPATPAPLQPPLEAPLTRPLFPPPLATLEPEARPAPAQSPASTTSDATTPPPDAPAPANTTVASLDATRPMLAPPSPPAAAPIPPVATTTEGDGTCLPTPERAASFSRIGRLARAQMAARPIGLSPEEFGRRLAKAAVAQTEDLVIYTARYQPMAYPLGDVMPLYGACIDVVIRAYRALGVDLQEEVQRGRGGGRGDTNIDHRRTENMRRFLTRSGASLPISTFPEDFKPGDIVTYHRPFSRVSTSHIAIVTDILAPTGRPMIVHNRGYGPQLEDALFVDRITGHYRYGGQPQQLRSPPAASSDAASGNKASTPAAVRAARAPGPQMR